MEPKSVKSKANLDKAPWPFKSQISPGIPLLDHYQQYQYNELIFISLFYDAFGLFVEQALQEAQNVNILGQSQIIVAISLFREYVKQGTAKELKVEIQRASVGKIRGENTTLPMKKAWIEFLRGFDGAFNSSVNKLKAKFTDEQFALLKKRQPNLATNYIVNLAQTLLNIASTIRTLFLQKFGATLGQKLFLLYESGELQQLFELLTPDLPNNLKSLAKLKILKDKDEDEDEDDENENDEGILVVLFCFVEMFVCCVVYASKFN
jgi:hypothetical protein